LLLIAAIVAMSARRLKIPYTIGLMLTGIVLAVSPFPSGDIEITKDLIFTIFLPPLIYEAAIYIKWQELRRDLPMILTLATVGVLLSAADHLMVKCYRHFPKRFGDLCAPRFVM
jgi:monovalent cation:H+ antiporter, CPA1 family